MDAAGMSSFLEIGETIAVEFKRCGNGIENDLYEKGCLERWAHHEKDIGS